jgi:hypothetical protein
MWFYDDGRGKYFRTDEDEEADHDGFPDVVADSIYAIGSAVICALIAVSVWLYRSLPWQ